MQCLTCGRVNPQDAKFCNECGIKFSEIISEEEEKESDVRKYLSYVTHPHDTLFKSTFSEKENVVDFLRSYLPPYLLELIELDTLEIVKGSFITHELRKYFSDMLYKVKLLEGKVYIYVLIEHKSYYEYHLPFQLLEYITQIWRREREEHERLIKDKDEKEKEEARRKFRYPFILPLVIYHGERKERVRYISEIVELPSERLKIYVPNFEYILYNIEEIPDEKIKEAVVKLEAMLWLFKHRKSEHLQGKLAELMRLISEKGDVREIGDLIIEICTYLLSVEKNLREKELKEIVERNVSYKIGGKFMARLQALILDAEKKGREEGKREGQIKGIRLALKIKFGKRGLIAMEEIEKIENLEKLNKVEVLLEEAKSVEEFIEGLVNLD